MHMGGLENRIINYAKWLHEHQHEVTIICNKYNKDFPLPQGVQVVKLPKLPVPKIFRMMAFNWQLGRYMQHHKFDFSLGMGRTSHHDAVLAPGNHLGYLHALGKKATSLDDKLQIKMDHIGHDGSKVVFAASQMMAHEVEKFYQVSPDKIQVLYPPLDNQKFAPISPQKRAEARAKLGIQPTTKVFGFVSSSHQRKGLPLLLKAFEQLQDFDVLLLTAGTPEIKSSLKNVKHLGFVKNTLDLYSLIDFYLHPAVYEPYGQVVAEAVSSGIPAFVSTTTGANEVLDSDTGKVLDANDLEGWVDIIKTAEPSHFQIPTDWAHQKGLTLHQHMTQMMNWAVSNHANCT